jgi:hypothetical protein
MRALVVAVLAAGCTNKFDLGDAALVDGLRLLGVQAEPPEAAPGETVKLTAWVVDTRGGSIDVSWSACLLPSNGVANVGCTDGSGNGLVTLGSGETITTTIPAVDANTLGPPDASDGVYLPIVVHVRGSDDALDAIYRLRARVFAVAGCTIAPPYAPHCEPNQNPVLESVEPLQDTPIVAHADSQWSLLPHYSGDSSEEYEVPGPFNPDVFERLTTQWFASAGTFPDMPVGGTGVQKLVLDRNLPPPGGLVDIWIVGHEERGGTTMLHRQLVLQ